MIVVIREQRKQQKRASGALIAARLAKKARGKKTPSSRIVLLSAGICNYERGGYFFATARGIGVCEINRSRAILG